MSKLTHFDDNGAAHMVDVSEKEITSRLATAYSQVEMSAEAFEHLTQGTAKKGDVLGTARLAGIMAAKQTPSLIPLCHPLAISKVAIEFSTSKNIVSIEASVRTTGQTGVEMEALTAASVTALTIYDMLKAVDKSMIIGPTHLLEKTGGKSGDFTFEAR